MLSSAESASFYGPMPSSAVTLGLAGNVSKSMSRLQAELIAHMETFNFAKKSCTKPWTVVS